MKFKIDPNIFERFPGVSIGVVIISDMVNDRNVEEILIMLHAEGVRQKELLTGVELGTLPEVTAWRYKTLSEAKSLLETHLTAKCAIMVLNAQNSSVEI